MPDEALLAVVEAVRRWVDRCRRSPPGSRDRRDGSRPPRQPRRPRGPGRLRAATAAAPLVEAPGRRGRPACWWCGGRRGPAPDEVADSGPAGARPTCRTTAAPCPEVSEVSRPVVDRVTTGPCPARAVLAAGPRGVITGDGRDRAAGSGPRPARRFGGAAAPRAPRSSGRRRWSARRRRRARLCATPSTSSRRRPAGPAAARARSHRRAGQRARARCGWTGATGWTGGRSLRRRRRGPAARRAAGRRCRPAAGRRVAERGRRLPDGTRLHAVLPPVSPAGTC